MQRIKRLRRIEPEPQGRQHRVIRVSGILMEIERERHLEAIGRSPDGLTLLSSWFGLSWTRCSASRHSKRNRSHFTGLSHGFRHFRSALRESLISDKFGHGWYISAFHSDKAFSSVGLAPLIAHVGFPAPAILAVWITFNESIGALLIGCGLFTRIAAVSAALGMAGALYTSLRLGEDWLRAALYLIVFIALTLTGAGKFSIDPALQTRKSNRRARKTSLSTS